MAQKDRPYGVIDTTVSDANPKNDQRNGETAMKTSGNFLYTLQNSKIGVTTLSLAAALVLYSSISLLQGSFRRTGAELQSLEDKNDRYRAQTESIRASIPKVANNQPEEPKKVLVQPIAPPQVEQRPNVVPSVAVVTPQVQRTFPSPSRELVAPQNPRPIIRMQGAPDFFNPKASPLYTTWTDARMSPCTDQEFVGSENPQVSTSGIKLEGGCAWVVITHPVWSVDGAGFTLSHFSVDQGNLVTESKCVTMYACVDLLRDLQQRYGTQVLVRVSVTSQPINGFHNGWIRIL